jgi:broad specificity phosphatase PhoE
MMRNLYLVRHASPAVQPERPAREWSLSERGIAEARLMATGASAWGLTAVYCSSEEKSRATALVLGDATGAPVRAVESFDELRMPEWIANADEFNDLVRSIFERPTEAQRGAETAESAAARFAAGIETVSAHGLPAAVVSHGRIITSWLMASGAIDDAFAFWRALPMPGWARIDLDQPPASWDMSFRT